MTSTKTSGPRVSAEDRRAQYLDVAARLATGAGVDAVTMEAVAAGAGVNKALLYRQFANRAELIDALYKQETSELDRSIARAIDGADTFDDKLRAWVRAWFGYIGRRGKLLGRLMDARRVPRHGDRQRSIDKLYGDWYAKEFALPREVGRDAAAILFAGLGGALDRWATSPNAATRRRVEETYVEVVQGSLRQLRAAHTHDT